MSKANFQVFQCEFITKLDLFIGEDGFGDIHFLKKFKSIMLSHCKKHTSIHESGNWHKSVGCKKKYTLVRRFNNRWRWCCGDLFFLQRSLKLCYQRSLFFMIFVIVLIFIFFHPSRLMKTKHLLCFGRIIRLVSRYLCRSHFVKWEYKTL